MSIFGFNGCYCQGTILAGRTRSSIATITFPSSSISLGLCFQYCDLTGFPGCESVGWLSDPVLKSCAAGKKPNIKETYKKQEHTFQFLEAEEDHTSLKTNDVGPCTKSDHCPIHGPAPGSGQLPVQCYPPQATTPGGWPGHPRPSVKI